MDQGVTLNGNANYSIMVFMKEYLPLPCIESKPNLSDLMALPIDFSLWYDIGLELGLEDYRLNIIMANNAGKPDSSRHCACDMYDLWLKSIHQPTYTKLAMALSTVGMREIAAALCQKYGMLTSITACLTIAL